jgi:cytochrome c biogenesis protein CcmG/thiol:disulfide interchange protein DsbE
LLTSGQPTIVNVWASWCAPCRQEHPLLMELAAEPGVRVVGINYKDQPENARRFLGALGNPFIAVGVDDSGRNAIEWGVYGVPETFILDGSGVIRHKHVGPLTPQTMAGFRAALAAAR